MPSPAKSQEEILQLFSWLLWQRNPVSCRDWKLHVVPDAILGALNQGLGTFACNIYKVALWKEMAEGMFSPVTKTWDLSRIILCFETWGQKQQLV